MISTRREMIRFLGSLPLLAVPARSEESPIQGDPAPDLDAVRAQFPQLQTLSNGHPITYLDSAGTTLRPRAVVDAMVRFYKLRNANPGKGLHSLAIHAMEDFEAARGQVGRFINAYDPLEIIWTRGTTEALNLLAAAWVTERLRPGDEIVLTIAEHASCMLPLQLAAQKAGATIRYVDVDDDGRLSLDSLNEALSNRPKLVCFTHVSNVLGAINPAKEICRRSKQAGARVAIDAAQSVPHLSVDVQDIGCDFAAFSSHKMLGPMGAGVLFARREVMEEMHVYQAGANMAHARGLTEWSYTSGALRFGAGTPSVADALGLAAATDLLSRTGRVGLWKREQKLTRYTLERLRGIRGLHIIGPTMEKDRVSIFSFVLDGVSVPMIVSKLDSAGICVRAGDLASMPLLQRFKLTAAARASLYVYTTEEEVDRLVNALNSLV